tara:strand:- start:258 stop:665 length:408 start_codon:yes stop_codon:yes gene_type:complete
MKRHITTIVKNTPINITETAWKKINNVLDKTKNKQGFLFSATGGGCNGFNYKLNTLSKKEYMNMYKQTKFLNYVKKDNIKVYIDPLSEIYLLGTTIDYIEEDFENNIYESKFKFTPEKNKATTCGCGVSFSPKIE